MRCVAFMRNVNQGQRGHPSTSDIVAGFADGGCPRVQTFQSNGTILFDSDEPASVVEQAMDAVAARSGHERQILWIPLSELAAIVDEYGATPEPRRFEFTLHSGAIIDADDAEVISRATDHRCSIVDAGEGWALVRNQVEGEGHATPVLESLTGRPATSRGLPTVIRLVSRFGR
ncbi:hypothetical protein GCM10025760_37530 [Microbacterium yannicii]|uniref:DUF1697 domain-containing protein n=1 Tax=Microbacterium yannicii TaxID=671622 RepID=A0ABP9MTP4_9MICO|nr:DUF1697 domain-containing protein [Microbacterium yannicii]MCO5952214.1 DUF1697 domain-containing protein [Microbacterium yannicii]